MAPVLKCISLGALRCCVLTVHLTREKYMWLESTHIIWTLPWVGCVFEHNLYGCVFLSMSCDQFCVWICLKWLSEMIMDINKYMDVSICLINSKTIAKLKAMWYFKINYMSFSIPYPRVTIQELISCVSSARIHGLSEHFPLNVK